VALTKVTAGLITANAVVDSFGTQSITGDKIGVNAINANNIVNSSITGAKLAANTVTGDVIGQSAISSNNIVSVSGSAITANSIANSAIQTGAIENYSRASGVSFGMRNRIINGAMMIAQRANTVTVSDGSSEYYSTDRFFGIGQSSDGAFTVAQSSVAPAGFVNSTLCTVTTEDSSIGASQFYLISQKIEGLNIADLAWGTASASPVTLSFWVRSSLTGTFGGSLRNSAVDRSYPFSYVINAANTWEYKTITIAGDTTGTWLTNNDVGIRLAWSLGDGSSRLGTAGDWNSNNNSGATGQVNLIGTNGATFYLTGVQLEKGSTPTSFEHRHYGTELQLCQRYYEKYSSSGETFGLPTAYVYNGAAIYGRQFYQVEKRAAPTITFSSTGNTLLECYATGAGSGLSYSGTISAEIVNTKSFAWNQPVSGISGGVAVMAGIRSGQSFQISAEL